MHLFGIGRRRARALPVRRRARALSVHPKLWINGEAQPPHWYRGLGTSGEALALTRLLITKLMLILNWAMLLVTTICVLSSCIHMMLALLSAMLFPPITKRFDLSSFFTSLLSTIKLVSKPVCVERSDTWHLPIILLASFTGRRPFLPWGVKSVDYFAGYEPLSDGRRSPTAQSAPKPSPWSPFFHFR